MILIGLHAIAAVVPLAVHTIRLAAQVNPTTQQVFVDDLTKILYTGRPYSVPTFRTKNEVSSALGVSMCLFLVWPGCTGDAIEQVHDVLGYPESTNEVLVWAKTMECMLTNLNGGVSTQAYPQNIELPIKINCN